MNTIPETYLDGLREAVAYHTAVHKRLGEQASDTSLPAMERAGMIASRDMHHRMATSLCVTIRIATSKPVAVPA